MNINITYENIDVKLELQRILIQNSEKENNKAQWEFLQKETEVQNKL